MGASAPPSDATAQGRKVVVCVAGGIAAFKVVHVVRSLTELGAEVRVVMTQSAHHFVGAQTFAALSGNPVATEMFGTGADAPHVELAREADLAIVAPATANALAKMALGLADDLFSSVLLTLRCPILIAPAMHTEMWKHPATQANVTTLEGRGATIIGPAEGALSSGDSGSGRMVEPEDIVMGGLAALRLADDLSGVRVLVTAGGTQEPIDPVRFVGNRSSGRMGFDIAREAAARGAKVTVVAGATSARPPSGVELISVATAEEMRGAVLGRAPDCDVIVKAAAVADFRPQRAVAQKLKKAAGPPELTLVPTSDILAELGSNPALRKPGSILVGFAAETEPDPGRLGRLAADKRRSKGADVIVANDVGSRDSGFEVATNRAVIADSDGTSDLGLVTKVALASALMDRVAELLRARRDH